MKILQIIDSLDTGGAERLIVETVPLQVSKGFQVDVLLLNGVKTPFYSELKAMGCCEIYSLGNSFYNPFYIFKIIPFLKKYDVAHVHLFPAQYFAVLAKIISFSKIKLVFTEHNTSNTRLNSRKYRIIEKIIYSFYTKIICISDDVKNVLSSKLRIKAHKLVVFENGVNLESIKQMDKSGRERFGFSDSDRLLIMVAGFRKQKDHETLLEALADLPNSYKLILVGDGERRQLICDKITELGLETRVTLLGIRADVYSLIKMCNVAILSSHWEGFGLAAVEAMACEIPVIGSNVVGLNQVIKGAGLLFEKGNHIDLKNQILSLEDEFLYSKIVISGIEKSKEYDVNLLVTKQIGIYKQIYEN